MSTDSHTQDSLDQCKLLSFEVSCISRKSTNQFHLMLFPLDDSLLPQITVNQLVYAVICACELKLTIFCKLKKKGEK